MKFHKPLLAMAFLMRSPDRPASAAASETDNKAIATIIISEIQYLMG